MPQASYGSSRWGVAIDQVAALLAAVSAWAESEPEFWRRPCAALTPEAALGPIPTST